MPYHGAIGRKNLPGRRGPGPAASGPARHGESMHLARNIAFAGAVFVTLAAAPRVGWAQFAQYTQPGTVDRGGPEATRDQFEAALEESRWRLGAVRLQPWIGVRNLRWSANPLGATEGSESEEGDLSASLGAGVRAYLPTGHSVFWTAHVLPEYVWWADQEDRNRVNGRFGAGGFAFFNRVRLELSGRRQEDLEVVSAELPQEVNNRRDTYTFAAETRLGFSTSVFGQITETRRRHLLEEGERVAGAPLQALDRNEQTLRAGVRYSPRERWTLGAGMEWTESESTGADRDLSSTGSAPFLEVLYSGPKFWSSASVELRTVEPEPGSALRETETETYSVQLGLEGNRLSPAIYARRSLNLSVDEDFSHFTHDVVGASLGVPLGRRTAIRAFGEIGENEFTGASPVDPDLVDRQDDVTSFGGELTFDVGRGLSLSVGGYRTTFDSNVPGEDRTLEVFRTGIDLRLGGWGWGDAGGGGWV